MCTAAVLVHRAKTAVVRLLIPEAGHKLKSHPAQRSFRNPPRRAEGILKGELVPL